MSDASGLFHHRIGGPCRCGKQHAPQPSGRNGDRSPGAAARIVKEYDYRAANDDLLYQVVRYQPKGFSQRRPDGNGGWINNLSGVRRVLYLLPELLSRPDEIVLLPEGEKDADRLVREGFLATTNPMGAGKWRAEYAKDLEGRRVVILPDNNDVGLKHGRDVLKSLRGIAAVVAMVTLPGVWPGWDVSDWLDAGHTVEELRELVTVAHEGAQSDQESTFDDDEHLREPGFRLIPLAGIVAEQIDWFWQGYIPFGMVTGLYGDPGVGKSTIALDLAARATTKRPMPDGTPGVDPMNVIILSAEDPVAQVIRPRLDAAGADIARVSTLAVVDDGDGETTRPVVIPDDLEKLEAAVQNLGAKLVIIDVLMAYLSGAVRSYRDQDVRRALAPLQAVAERTGAAIIVIGHPTKDPKQAPIYRVGGSIGIVGAYRACLVAARDPDSPDLCVLAPLKISIAKMPPAISYRITDADGVGVVVWEGSSKHTVETLLTVSSSDGRGEALHDAEDFLGGLLRDGSVPVKALNDRAEAEGISYATLRRAKKDLGVEAVHVGQPGKAGYWVWTLPPEDAQEETEDALPGEMSALGPDEQVDAPESHEGSLTYGTPSSRPLMCPSCWQMHPFDTTCVEAAGLSADQA